MNGMKTSKTMAAWVLVLVALATLLTAGRWRRQTGPEDVEVYFRQGDLGAVTDQALPTYGDAEPGESTLLERAFEGAPPQIPHTVEDMLPIGLGENECMDCHHPENVTSKDEIPIPESHFQRPVMAAGATGEAMVWKVRGYQKGEDVAGSRYNCSMCHTPQAIDVETPKNLFGTK